MRVFFFPHLLQNFIRISPALSHFNRKRNEEKLETNRGSKILNSLCSSSLYAFSVISIGEFNALDFGHSGDFTFGSEIQLHCV